MSSTTGPGRLLVENRQVVFLEALATAAAVWWLASAGFGLTDTLSSPPLVAAAVAELLASGEWVPQFAATGRRIAYGFAISTVLGTAFGLLMGLYGFWEKVFQDYITVGLAFPSVFIALFAAMAFGVGDTAPTVTAGIAPFPFVAQNVYQGVNNVDTDLLEMARSFEVSRTRTLGRVVFRSVLPEWFAGVRYGFAGAWKLVTLAEAIAAEQGVGFMIQTELTRLSMTGVLAWTVLFGAVIAVFEYLVLRRIEERVFDWREQSAVAW
ncbi:ABC transporter permease [Halolamina salifodinae]|uniref:ABC-type nitrate/sulfonate/bicarbonate transport system permease component n=1 Tax=Halolamina salifodinae TaxID=1202767 RepID=A0A8T4GX02_9EURY|nr:ABC transporter permease subunit [Halolamina salifodinae]MBP1986662.1 ABC-type nitrate/sulfonate/bicarbonate transport system permease component [Halolamina salifodinae]